MWKPFESNGNLFMIKTNINDTQLELFLTDLKTIWCTELSSAQVLDVFKQQNPLFAVKEEDAICEVVDLVNDGLDDSNVNIVKIEDNYELELKFLKSNFTLQYKFTLTKSTPEKFLKEVTVPLIQTVKHLETCKEVLCNVVEKKDRELEEYKLEKGLISREDLVTEKFDQNVLNFITDNSMLNVFGQSKAFWDTFKKSFGNVEVKIESVQKDPWNHIKRKRKVYSSKTATKKGKGISYAENE